MQQEVRTGRSGELLVHRPARVVVVRSAQYHDGGYRLTAMTGDPDHNAPAGALRDLPPSTLGIQTMSLRVDVPERNPILRSPAPRRQ